MEMSFSHRGCYSAVANALTAKPSAGMGSPPAAQPTALAALTVGSPIDEGGDGNTGLGPVPSLMSRLARSAQALNSNVETIVNPSWSRRVATFVFMMVALELPRDVLLTR